MSCLREPRGFCLRSHAIAAPGSSNSGLGSCASSAACFCAIAISRSSRARAKRNAICGCPTPIVDIVKLIWNGAISVLRTILIARSSTASVHSGQLAITVHARPSLVGSGAHREAMSWATVSAAKLHAGISTPTVRSATLPASLIALAMKPFAKRWNHPALPVNARKPRARFSGCCSAFSISKASRSVGADCCPIKSISKCHR